MAKDDALQNNKFILIQEKTQEEKLSLVSQYFYIGFFLNITMLEILFHTPYNINENVSTCYLALKYTEKII